MTDNVERAIAIVGVGAVLPDAPDVPTFWDNVATGRYSISDVDPARWNPDFYFDPDRQAIDKTYSKIGGWVREWNWSPLEWRLPIPPKVSDAMDRTQQWAIVAARQALADYGHPERPLNHERTAVVIGNAMGGDLHYLTAMSVYFPEYGDELTRAPSFAALAGETRDAIIDEFRTGIRGRFPDITEDSMPGELANIISGRIANLFDFHGPNFVVDAACASAMAAIDAAVEGLEDGEYDAVLAGGVDANMSASTFVKFCKIGALSATGTRPFGDGADGFVMGEGAALFVLKRLADAERDGDHVHAVIRGIGGASDGRGKGITAPNPVGQRLAIQRAWRNAGIVPGRATLIEAHGTSTKVGDVVETQSFAEAFADLDLPPGTLPLGSVKSNIGHLKGAAGAAGILKVALALDRKLLPPSLGAEVTNPNIDFARSPLAVNSELRPWDANGEARSAGVSAFGFGGTNFHVVLEEHVPGRISVGRSTTSIAVHAARPAKTEVKAPLRGAVVVGGADDAEVTARLEQIRAAAEAGDAPAPTAPAEADLRADVRVAIDFGDADELAARAAKAIQALKAGNPKGWKLLANQGVFRGEGPAHQVALLYTGQGSQYVNMLADLRETEPIVRATFDEADRIMEPLIGRPLSDIIFVDADDEVAVAEAEEQLRQTEITQPAVLTADLALTRLLDAYGIQPDMVMGHSLGEYGALVVSDALSFADALEAVSARGQEMASLSLADNGLMAAVFAPLDEIERTLATIDDYVVVANINSASQAVIGGSSAAVEAASAALAEAGHVVVPLPVSHAFHTSIVAPAAAPLREVLERLDVRPPVIPTIANVDGRFYPMGPAVVPDMIDILCRQIASPVQFIAGLHSLHDAGARVFVEVGPKRALHGFADEVLGDEPDVAVLYTNHPKVGGVASFNQGLCGLYAEGLGVGRDGDASVARRADGGRSVLSSAPAAARPVPEPVPAAAAVAAPTSGTASGPDGRYVELGRLFADVLGRGLEIMGGPAPADALASSGDLVAREPVVITGAALGLPGTEFVFDDGNLARLLDGESFIDAIPVATRQAIVDKHITRLMKNEAGDGSWETIDSQHDVLKLAGQRGHLDMVEQFGLSADRVAALDITSELAIGAGIDALRDAGIPLTMHYKRTTTGGTLPERWELPDALRDDTGIIFASAFPGADGLADEVARYEQDRARRAELANLAHLRERIRDDDDAVPELEHMIHEIQTEVDRDPYVFDRRFLFRVLPMGHSQLAEHIGARGPNTQVNAACASTTQAVSLAEDWIRLGRCARVLVVAGDDVTSETLIEWVGAGFLASGAAATDEVVEEAALPFDRRRHGMIMGMGAAALVVESAASARSRGIAPICQVLSSVTANSAFHGSRLDVDHIRHVMEDLVASGERRWGVDRREIADQLVFVSHETYTPARGGSAQAEVDALRFVFGEAADHIVVANTKGFTGHAMGAGVEDVLAVKALETGIVPPIANMREPDPELGSLNLSKGGAYPVTYALRLAAGFGSQVSMSLLRWVPPPDGRRHEPDQLGFTSRITDPDTWQRWLADVSGHDAPELEIVQRTLRIRDDGPPSGMATRLDRSVADAPAVVSGPPQPAPTGPAPAPRPAPAAAAPAAAPAAVPEPARAGEDDVVAAVLGVVAAQTGYPEDMLELDLDLEADLGIDTVKQAETFAAIRERYGIERDESLSLRDYPTLAHVVEFVRERAAGLTTAAPAEAAPAAAEAAPAAVPEPARAGEDDVVAAVLGVVAAQTGYPEDMLELDLDLEADLGIDTVKQAETFAAIRERYGIERDESLSLRDYPTLAHVVEFVRERAAGLTTAAPAEAAPAAAPAAAVPEPARAGEDDVVAAVLGVVAAQTGYPEDMLELDLDLEADLGVDTVKQAETFAAIRERYGIERDESLSLRDYPTLAHVVEFVRERAAGLTTAAPAEAAPAAAPAAAVPEPARAGEDDVVAAVLGVVAAQTGYPEDMLELDLDLEADLGVDTVKQAETFAAIRERYGIERDESLSLRDYPTLAHVVEFVRERAAGLTTATPAEAAPEATEAPPSATPALAKGDDDAAAQVRRRVPIPVLRPGLDLCVETGVVLDEGAPVLVMGDEGGVGSALVGRLEQRGVDVLAVDGAPTADELLERLDAWLGDRALRGVYWLPALDVEIAIAEQDLADWREALRARVKLLYRVLRHTYDHFGSGSFLVTGTRLGGQHGYGPDGATAPMGGGVVGLAKAFKRERPDALVKAVDFPTSRKTAALADRLVEETLRDPGAVEIGWRDDQRSAIALDDQPLPNDEHGIDLGPDSVIVVTGAAGSIVSAIIGDLARASGATFHLLDLAPPPDPSDPDVLAFGENRDGLKRTIFERLKEAGERATPAEVEQRLAGIERRHAGLAALEAIEASGGTAHYHQVDLRDGDAVARVGEQIRDGCGSVDALIHAGGLEISRLLPDKEPDEFDLVFDVKVDGWFNLLRGLGDLRIGSTVVFSSIAGRFGNGGQTDYSAANDLLCKQTAAITGSRPGTLGIAVDWTAWDDIGMATRGSVPTVMAAAGIDMLPAAAGIPIVRRELTAGGRTREVVVAGDLGILDEELHPDGGLDVGAGSLLATRVTESGQVTLTEVRGLTLTDGLVVAATLDPTVQPFLAHHRIDGTPVLPGAMGVESFAAAAALLFPEREVVAVEDVDFLAPFKFFRDEPREIVVTARFDVDGDDILARCRLVGTRVLANQTEPQTTVHFTGSVRLGTRADDLGTGAVPAISEPTLSAEQIYRVYFHGPAYQVLDAAWSHDGGMCGRWAADVPAATDPPDAALTTSPRWLELCFQTAGVWEIGRAGALALPTHLDRVTLGPDPDESVDSLAAVVTHGDDGADVTVVDGDGRIRLMLTGYRTTLLPSPIDDALGAPFRDAVGQEHTDR